jgi:fatty-acyl-CoA synthase
LKTFVTDNLTITLVRSIVIRASSKKKENNLTIKDIFSHAIKCFQERTSVVCGEHCMSYEETGRRVHGLSKFLAHLQISSGDRVSILDFNSMEYLETYFAASVVGAVLNPLNYRLSVEELCYIISDAGSRVLIVNSHFNENVNQLLKKVNSIERVIWIGEEPEIETSVDCYSYDDAVKFSGSEINVDVKPEDYVHLYYTSGTTGKPKGVILTHRNVCQHALGAITELKLTNADRWGHIAPMFHLADAWAVFAITQVGGQHVIQPQFDAEATLNLIETSDITISNLIPTMLNLMVKHPEVTKHDYSSLRVILSGGAPIAPAVVRSIMEIFKCDYIQTYGMTETSPYLTFSILKDHLKNLSPEKQFHYKAKTGKPFITVELQVVRVDGSHIETDDKEVGEIIVKGETVTPGYWNLPNETEEAFQNGWLKTGDLATMDSEGYVNIVDRLRDMIICGGENIYCVEVENVLYQHPDVLEAAVFGKPDELWGEIVAAAVVLKPGSEICRCELVGFCREHLTGFKTPRAITFLDELPKTGSGKIYKKGLKS